MSRLTLSYSDLYTYVSNFLGLTAPEIAPTDTNLTRCEKIVRRALRQFMYPIDVRNGKVHKWSFLEKRTSLNILSGKWKYALPIDFSKLTGIIHYDSDELQPPLKKRDKDYILEKRGDVNVSSWPDTFAIVPSQYDLDIGTAYELWLYPTPDQSYLLEYFYKFDPLQPTSSTDLLPGGIRACEAILETCLAVAESQENDATGVHTAQAMALTQALIIDDSDITTTDKIGNLYTGNRVQWPPIRPYLVTFDDDNIY